MRVLLVSPAIPASDAAPSRIRARSDDEDLMPEKSAASTVGFAGLEHLGVVSAVAMAAKGRRVVAFDIDTARVSAVASGDLPFFEPGLTEALSTSRSLVEATSTPGDLARCGIVFVALDVRTDGAGRSDLGPVTDLIDVVTTHAVRSAVVVVLSQVPPGFTRAAAARVTAARPDLTVIYQVETLVFGAAFERARSPERIIFGTPASSDAVPGSYAELLKLFTCPTLHMSYESAELTKVAINLLLVASVSMTNTLADISEHVGADWTEIVPALRLDKRIGPHSYIVPGLGISGGNLERDLRTIADVARRSACDARIVEACIAHAAAQRRWALARLNEAVLQQDRATIAIWGLAYKAGTSSIKTSPAIDLLDELEGHDVRVHDPRARLPERFERRVRQVDDPLDACVDADALVVMTPWPEYRVVDAAEIRAALSKPIVIDPFGILDASSVHRAALVHVRRGVGR